MEQELRCGLDLGQLVLLKKRVWANYEHVFMGKKNVKNFLKTLKRPQ